MRGPVEDEDLRRLIEDGILNGDSPVLPEGGSEWTTVDRMSSALPVTYDHLPARMPDPPPGEPSLRLSRM